ncbi:hypothetical protein ACN47E_001306 [Coniothyrium glycines]
MPTTVVIPANRHGHRRVLVDQIHSVVSNRVQDSVEQYLVRWITQSPMSMPPLSWHSINELVHCLEHVQDYLDTREKQGSMLALLPVDGQVHESLTPSQNVEYQPSIDVFNGVLVADENGFLFCRSQIGDDIPSFDIETVQNAGTIRTALQASVGTALILIRAKYVRKLAHVPGKPIHLLNLVDATTPSLRFRYISDYVLDQTSGVYRLSSEAQAGCTRCSPHMGRNIGCEYTKKCDCLEYAAVDESRITDPQMKADYAEALETGSSTLGFPKKFPYFAEGTKREKTGCLVPFYLNSRSPIYECNSKCHCGPFCRNKNVQFGRQVEVEIFRTEGGRGWGLRCREDLHLGQFIDTYRGEVITDAEATRREHSSSKAKASYLYTLDKFAKSEGIKDEDLYIVDGEFMGGPSKFMNHSCDPNCRQFTVSYNKHDAKVYDIAFFACRAIPAGEELTFDYLDKEEVEETVRQPGPDAVPCLCGTARCRRWLWT